MHVHKIYPTPSFVCNHWERCQYLQKKNIEKWKIILLCGSSNHVEVANNGINKHLYANLNLPILTVMVADL